jgi:hypothetical protein
MLGQKNRTSLTLYYVVFKKHNLGLSKVLGIVIDDAPSAIRIKMAQPLFFYKQAHVVQLHINQQSIIALFMNKT